ncbi:hypothetical protein CC78DRAFT_99543 [Lojkania enalia]|uniref:Uncharacterized protein n=1 Tax=Lojkania enalia TaxID=147567 RepID=A0A9P4JXC4_9PLEO|nr:hypothetical protein CC78DRAFT_99543 [Didymosphaeria enalia]
MNTPTTYSTHPPSSLTPQPNSQSRTTKQHITTLRIPIPYPRHKPPPLPPPGGIPTLTYLISHKTLYPHQKKTSFTVESKPKRTSIAHLLPSSFPSNPPKSSPNGSKRGKEYRTHSKTPHPSLETMEGGFPRTPSARTRSRTGLVLVRRWFGRSEGRSARLGAWVGAMALIHTHARTHARTLACLHTLRALRSLCELRGAVRIWNVRRNG